MRNRRCAYAFRSMSACCLSPSMSRHVLLQRARTPMALPRAALRLCALPLRAPPRPLALLRLHRRRGQLQRRRRRRLRLSRARRISSAISTHCSPAWTMMRRSPPHQPRRRSSKVLLLRAGPIRRASLRRSAAASASSPGHKRPQRRRRLCCCRQATPSSRFVSMERLRRQQVYQRRCRQRRAICLARMALRLTMPLRRWRRRIRTF